MQYHSCKVCSDDTNFVKCKEKRCHIRSTVARVLRPIYSSRRNYREDEEDVFELKLMQAIDQSDVHALKKHLLNREQDELAQMYGEISFFWLAVQQGCVHVIQVLLDEGFDVNDGSGGYLPINWAVAYNKFRIVKTLLHNGADPNGNYDVQSTLLQKAIEFGHTETVELLLSHGAEPNAIIDPNIYSPLFTAASYQRESELKLLLDYGVELNRLNAKGFGILHYLVRVHHERAYEKSADFLELVLSRGADVDLRSPIHRNETPLHLAARMGKHCPALDRLACWEYTSCERPRKDLTMSILLEHGAEVDAKNELGQTALHLAIEAGCAYSTQLLINAQADVNVMDRSGNTPLGLVLTCESFNLSKYLLFAGACTEPYLSRELKEDERDMLAKYTVARLAAGFRVETKVLQCLSIKGWLGEFEKLCLEELEYMRKEILDCTNVSILVFLQASRRRRAIVVKKNGGRTLEHFLGPDRFVRLIIYREMLEYKFFEGLHHIDTAEAAIESFDVMFKLRMPLEVLEIMSEKMPLTDLKNVIKAVRGGS